MFGFDGIASFAHNLETVFDRLRNGTSGGHRRFDQSELWPPATRSKPCWTRLPAGAPRIRAGSARNSGRTAPADRARRNRPAGRSVPAPPARRRVAAAGPDRDWRIRFRPGPDILLNGTNPLLLLRELRELGQLRSTSIRAAIPSARRDRSGALLPRLGHGSEHRRPRAEAIRDIFIFVEDDCELTIERAPELAAEARPPGAAPAGPERPGGRGAAGVGRRIEHSRVGRQAGSTRQPGGRTGDGAGAPERGRRPPRRCRHPGDLRGGRPADGGAARELDEHPHAAAQAPPSNDSAGWFTIWESSCDKQVDLTIEGADTELDKTVIDQLNDPLVHLIRNSMDHGIETPEARRAAGKHPTATIHLSALHSGANVLIR